MLKLIWSQQGNGYCMWTVFVSKGWTQRSWGLIQWGSLEFRYWKQLLGFYCMSNKSRVYPDPTENEPYKAFSLNITGSKITEYQLEPRCINAATQRIFLHSQACLLGGGSHFSVGWGADEAEIHLLAAAGLTGRYTGGRMSVRESRGRPESEEEKGKIKRKEGVNGQKDEVLDTHKWREMRQ